jgi:hypothetical protein
MFSKFVFHSIFKSSTQSHPRLFPKIVSPGLVRYAFPLVALSFIGCATSTRTEAPNPEQQRLLSTSSEIQQLADCTESTQGNDALFNKKCAKMLDGKTLYAKIREVEATGGTYKIIADVVGTDFFACQLTPDSGKAASTFLASLKPLDNVTLSGKLKSFKTTEKDSPFKKHIAHEVDLEPCEVHEGLTSRAGDTL